MNNALFSHIQAIIERTQSLAESSNHTLTAAQVQGVEVINRNAMLLLDACDRMETMDEVELATYFNHRVRNLLTPVRGYAQALAVGRLGPVTEQQAADLHHIVQRTTSFCSALEAITGEDAARS